MFNRLFGKGKDSEKKDALDAADTRGLEVVEDDQDTAWGLWDSVLAEQDSRFSELPPAESVQRSEPQVTPRAAAPAAAPPPSMFAAPAHPEGSYAPTEPMPLEIKPLAQRVDEALARVELHHGRVAHSIRTMWGHKECVQYINKLVMGGSDTMGRSRVGFHQEAVEAMLELADLHEAQFGPVDEGPQTGFGGFNLR
jgi:hypothetical protein